MIHTYLRAIGFKQIRRMDALNRLLASAAKEADGQSVFAYGDYAHFCEMQKIYGQSMGIILFGEMDEEDQIGLHGYYPYFEGSEISTIGEVSVEKRMEDERYLGMCEDERVGVSLIFTVVNGLSYIGRAKEPEDPPAHADADRELPVRAVVFSALSVDGAILLPVQKKEGDFARAQKEMIKRHRLIRAAKSGDQDAMEELSYEDMDQYYTATRRLAREDVFTIVDTYFMPYGIECDRYSVMGEILAFRKRKNSATEEEVWQLKLSVNGIHMDVCISVDDLTGEPEIGRRFKGTIWLQGRIIG